MHQATGGLSRRLSLSTAFLERETRVYKTVQKRLVAIVCKVKVAWRPIDTVGRVRPQQRGRLGKHPNGWTPHFEPTTFRPSRYQNLKAESSDEPAYDLKRVSLWTSRANVKAPVEDV